jgi:hypothetical protein
MVLEATEKEIAKEFAGDITDACIQRVPARHLRSLTTLGPAGLFLIPKARILRFVTDPTIGERAMLHELSIRYDFHYSTALFVAGTSEAYVAGT